MLTSYKHLAIDDFGGPPTLDEIRLIEQALDRQLPQSFKDFLAVANGGYLDYVIDIAFDGANEAFSFPSIYSTHPQSPRAFLAELEIERTIRNIPSSVLPFASDGESVVYLDLTIPGFDPVLAWIAGMPGWTGLSAQGGSVRLADSFDGYVDLLMVDQHMIGDLLQKAIQSNNVDRLQELREYLAIGLPNWREIFHIDAE
jgi:hypothetical protein